LALLQENGVNPPPPSGSGSATEIYVAREGRVVGVLHVADSVRPGAREAIARLKATGIRRVTMLTGDNRATADAIAAEAGVDEVFAELLPEAKVAAIAEMQAGGRRVAMVGDGINDAPALARAVAGSPTDSGRGWLIALARAVATARYRPGGSLC
jgi:P-type E1-E2 ATPase